MINRVLAFFKIKLTYCSLLTPQSLLYFIFWHFRVIRLRAWLSKEEILMCDRRTETHGPRVSTQTTNIPTTRDYDSQGWELSKELKNGKLLLLNWPVLHLYSLPIFLLYIRMRCLSIKETFINFKILFANLRQIVCRLCSRLSVLCICLLE